MDTTQVSIIVTAGGVGKRMGTSTPKQFLLLLGRPILMHTLERLHTFLPGSQILLTLPQEGIETWENLCAEHQFDLKHQVVVGGEERFHSVQNALTCCVHDLVLVHDGVRPLVSNQTILNGIEAIQEHAAAIPVLSIFESMREVSETENHLVERSRFRIVQTPQFFRREILQKAYQLGFRPEFTDDASVVEALGERIFLFKGNAENLKITQQSDLPLAEFFISRV